MLRIDDSRTGGLQTNGNVIMPSHDDLALTIQGNSAWPTGDFDPLTHGEWRVPLHADRHDQARAMGARTVGAVGCISITSPLSAAARLKADCPPAP